MYLSCISPGYPYEILLNKSVTIREETGSENSLMTRQSGGLQLASLSSVWPSLTPNAKKVLIVERMFSAVRSSNLKH